MVFESQGFASEAMVVSNQGGLFLVVHVIDEVFKQRGSKSPCRRSKYKDMPAGLIHRAVN
jgi:hypothetical protein